VLPAQLTVPETLPETFQAGEGTLKVTHEGIGRFINPGSSVFYSATAWRS